MIGTIIATKAAVLSSALVALACVMTPIVQGGSTAGGVAGTVVQAPAPNQQPVHLAEGQTTEEVEKILGNPEDQAVSGEDLVYTYPTVKVFFKNGKLVDVQEQKGFSADWLDLSDRSSRSKHSRIFGQDYNTRLEMYDKASKEPDGVVLTNIRKHTSFVVFPAQRMYLAASQGGAANYADWQQLFWPSNVDDACSVWLKIAAAHKTQMTCKTIGPETINGRSALKYQAAGSQSGFLWVDQELGIVLKMEFEKTQIELRNVTEEALQPVSFFEIPSGYQPMQAVVR